MKLSEFYEVVAKLNIKQLSMARFKLLHLFVWIFDGIFAIFTDHEKYLLAWKRSEIKKDFILTNISVLDWFQFENFKGSFCNTEKVLHSIKWNLYMSLIPVHEVMCKTFFQSNYSQLVFTKVIRDQISQWSKHLFLFGGNSVLLRLIQWRTNISDGIFLVSLFIPKLVTFFIQRVSTTS